MNAKTEQKTQPPMNADGRRFLPRSLRGLFCPFESVFYLRPSAFICGFAFFCVLLQSPALSAEPVIRANLSVATTTVDQPVELQIEIQNARIIDPPDVAADHLQIDMAGDTPLGSVANGDPPLLPPCPCPVLPSHVRHPCITT